MIPTFLLNETVTVTRYLGDNAFGPTWGNPQDHKARVEARRRLARDSDGRETFSDVTVYLPGGTLLAVDDQLEWEGRTYRVTDVLSHRLNGKEQYVEAVLI